MNRIISSVCLLCSVFLLVACHDDGVELPEDDAVTFDRTVLVYMAAQNDLSRPDYYNDYLGYHKADSAEIAAAAHTIAPAHCLLVYVDDKENPRIYRVNGKKAPTVVRRWEEDANSADSEQLADVLSWMAGHFPAMEYGPVMWSLGTGWMPVRGGAVRSFGLETAGGRDFEMNIEDMASAIGKSGVRLRYLMFDACLMQSLETCFALRNVSDYIIGSPIAISASGGYYTGLVERGFFEEDVIEIAKTYCADVTSDSLRDVYNGYGIVMSVVETAALEHVALTLRDLLPRSAFAGRNEAGLSGVTKYAKYASSFGYRPHCYDAYEAVSRGLSAEDGAMWRASLDSAVVWHYATPSFEVDSWSRKQSVNTETAVGVSIFIPSLLYTNNAAFCTYGDLNAAFQNTEWYEAAGWAQTGW